LRVQEQIEAVDRKSVIEEIVESQKLDGYMTTDLDDIECSLVAYVRGDYNKPIEDEHVEVRCVWEGFVNNVQLQNQQNEVILPEPEVVNPAKLDEED
jgi:hypothetical protein